MKNDPLASRSQLLEEIQMLDLLGHLIKKNNVPFARACMSAAHAWPRFYGVLNDAHAALQKGDDIYELLCCEREGATLSYHVPRLIKWGSIGGTLQQTFLDAADIIRTDIALAEKGDGEAAIQAVRFYRICGIGIGSGVPFLDVLNLATHGMPEEAVFDIMNVVREGDPMLQGLCMRPDLFESLEVSLIDYAQWSGTPALASLFVSLSEWRAQNILQGYAEHRDSEIWPELVNYQALALALTVNGSLPQSAHVLAGHAIGEKHRAAFKALSDELARLPDGSKISDAMKSLDAHFPSDVRHEFMNLTLKGALESIIHDRKLQLLA